MNTIEVDNEVYQALEKHVTGFQDTPNTVLRRMLGLSEDAEVLPGKSRLAPKTGRTKAPKVDLATLVRIGSVSDGERLSFRDYQQNKVNGVEAIISGKQLEYEGKRIQCLRWHARLCGSKATLMIRIVDHYSGTPTMVRVFTTCGRTT